MPRVDRNLARLAIYELTRTDTDAAVVLAEAVALAGDLSTDESPAFLNGVLGSVSRSLSSTAS
jgi:N utilization substance protein B